MIPILRSTDRAFATHLAHIVRRAEVPAARIGPAVARIIAAVRSGGDRALCELTARFDGVRIPARRLRVSQAELQAAVRQADASGVRALRLAAHRIEAFHRRQRQQSWVFRDGTGILLGERLRPLSRVGVYVPGGKGAYPSSVLMNVIPARVAGVKEIIMVSPPATHGYNPYVLVAALLAGVTAMYKVGGAQAIAALAHGTETIPAVDKIVGPGNIYVQTAKKMVFGTVDIDTVAGPSEVLIIADAQANPDFVAADLLAEAEHGTGEEMAILLTPSLPLAREVAEAMRHQLVELPRRKDVIAVLRRRGLLGVVRNLQEAVNIANRIAPEHLELMVAAPNKWATRITNAGTVFLGPHSPAALGDYIAGPNHILPTGGAARFASPLGVYDFVKRTNLINASRAGLQQVAEVAMQLAEIEGYRAHGLAIARRLHTDGRR